MNSKTGNWIHLAVIVSLCGGLANRLGAEGIEATGEGTPIDLSAQNLGKSAELNGEQIRVEASAGQQGTLHLFDLEFPVIDSEGYAVVGDVRYEGVTGDGFLEMWNHMPAEKGGTEIAQSFFSRTLGLSGPMGKLAGDSEWRAFQLPAFVNDGSGRRPLKLTLNVVLPGEGAVEVRGLKLQTLEIPSTGGPAAAIGSVLVIVILAFILGAGAVALTWFLKKRRADSELRRIQALDS